MFHDDIWFNIIQFLSCRTLKSICLLSKQFYRIINDNDLFNKAKLHFPRFEGVCKCFDLLKDYSDILDNDEIRECYDEKFIVPDDMLNKVIENVTMTRGDIVIMKGFDNCVNSFNDGSYVFDGVKLIGLCYMKQEEREVFLTNTIADYPITLGYWCDHRANNIDQYYSNHRYNCIMKEGKVVAKLNSRQEIVALTDEDIKLCKSMRINI